MRRFADEIAKLLARFVLSIFFRKIEVEGLERVPRDGPLVYVVNHPSAIVDPMLVVGFLPRRPRFLARHGLWDIWAMKPLLALAGAVPVYRRQDEGSDMSKNVSTFARCHEELGRGGTVALFPEGISHTEPSIQQLKTGAARIALEAEPQPDAREILIVPVGLTFDAKEQFRSRVLIRVGAAIDPTPYRPRYAEDPRGTVQALTAQVDRALREVTLNYESWQRARVLDRAADLYARGSTALPEPRDLSDQFSVRKAFAEGHEAMRQRAPERVAALERSVDRYDRMLRFTGLRDEHVISTYPEGRVVGYVLRALALFLLRFPLAVIGGLLNWLPYKVPGWVSKPFERSPEQPASKKVVAAIFAFPVVWALEAAVTGALWGGGAALGMAVLAPLSGYVALRFFEDQDRLVQEARVYLRLRRHREIWAHLREQRRRLAEQVVALAEEYQSVQP